MFLQPGRKHCWNRRNCSSRAFFPFPKVFSKDTEREGEGETETERDRHTERDRNTERERGRKELGSGRKGEKGKEKGEINRLTHRQGSLD